MHAGSRVHCFFAVSQLQCYFFREQQKTMTQVSVRIQVVCSDFRQSVYLTEGIATYVLHHLPWHPQRPLPACRSILPLIGHDRTKIEITVRPMLFRFVICFVLFVLAMRPGRGVICLNDRKILTSICKVIFPLGQFAQLVLKVLLAGHQGLDGCCNLT